MNVKVDHTVLAEAATLGRPQLVGAIDQGTSSTRFLLFTPLGRIAASAQLEHAQIFPTGVEKVCTSKSTMVGRNMGFLDCLLCMAWKEDGMG